MREVRSDEGRLTNTTYSSRYFTDEIPEQAIPRESMPARAAHQLIHDELNLDGNPALNLASFVTTWMEPEAQQLATESLNRNFVDQDEYPQTERIHQRVVSMIGGLFNAPDSGQPCGTATIGSSEAIMLGLLAHKWSWRAARRRQRPAERRLRRRRPHLLGEVHQILRRRAAGDPADA